MGKLLGVHYRGRSYCVDYVSATEFTMQDHDRNFIHSKNLSPGDRKEIGRHHIPKPRLKAAALAVAGFNWRWVAVAGLAAAGTVAALYFCN